MLVTEALLECDNRIPTLSVTAIPADRFCNGRTDNTEAENDHVTERTRDNETVHETGRIVYETNHENDVEQRPTEKATSQPTRKGQRMTKTMITDMGGTETTKVVDVVTAVTAAVHVHKRCHQEA